MLYLNLILGSQSPQRKEILNFYRLPFLQVSPDFIEELVPFEGDPVGYVKTLSEGKSSSLVPRFPEHVILTADTVVYKEGKIFNKPANSEENFAMLKELNGSWHSVFTAVTVQKDKMRFTECEETRIQFHSLSDSELYLYLKAFQGTNKAGGYSIQMGGSVIVKRMEGCFYNAMGLSTSSLQKVLKEVGINLWDYLAA